MCDTVNDGIKSDREKDLFQVDRSWHSKTGLKRGQKKTERRSRRRSIYLPVALFVLFSSSFSTFAVFFFQDGTILAFGWQSKQTKLVNDPVLNAMKVDLLLSLLGAASKCSSFFCGDPASLDQRLSSARKKDRG